MRIESTEIKKTVYDYDFGFASGQLLSFTIDPSEGDTIDLGNEVIRAFFPAKPNPINPEVKTPERRVTIYVSQLSAVETRQRELVALTPEQEAEWRRTLASLS